MLSVVKKDSPAVPVKKSSTYEKKKASDDRVMSGSPTDNRQNQRRLSKWIRTAWRIVGGTVNIILCLHRNIAARQSIRKSRQIEDIAADQIRLKEFSDPFTGEPVSKGK